jgi:hypothetical protein
MTYGGEKCIQGLWDERDGKTFEELGIDWRIILK